MTNLQKIALRQSEIRTRLHDLGAVSDLTDEIRGEISTLTTEMKDLEIRSQACIAAGEAPDVEPVGEPGDEQLYDLARRANAGEVFDAALEHRSTDGATRELQDELNLAMNQIPTLLLETRAVTPAPTNVQSEQSEIIPGVFPDSCAAFLGVDMPSVPVGDAIFPVLTQNAIAGVPAENAVPSGTGIDSEGATTGSFSAELLTPSRIQAAFFYSREDRARFAGMDAALRMNLSESLSDKLDQQILAGDEGLLDGTNLADHTQATETTFAEYVSQFGYSRVDGKYAASTDDLRIVAGSDTYAHMGGAYRHNNADDFALPRLMDITGGVKVSAHVPATATNKQNAVIRLGMRRDMVACIWEAVTIIPDEVTLASKGEIVITAVMLHAVKILRADGFYKQQSAHA